MLIKSVFLLIFTISAAAMNTAFQSLVAPKAYLPFSRYSFDVIQGNQDRLQEPTSTATSSAQNRLVYLPNGDYVGGSINTFTFFNSIAGFSGSNSIGELRKFARTPDGKYNNQQHTSYGSAEIALVRHCPALYKDGHAAPLESDFAPRVVSEATGKVTYPIQLNPDNVTMALTIWGQFIDHDIGLTNVDEEEEMPIKIPKCDPFMDVACQGNKKIPFKRSTVMPGDGPRYQMNSITSWVDGSMVYGSSKEVADRLRAFQLGRMKQRSGKMLPLKQNDLYGSLDAGDVRANENLILLSYHTIFMREHNRLCKLIATKHPSMSDQEIYQTARNYNVGLIQKITFDDFLPSILGPEAYARLIGPYKGYNPNIDSTVESQLTTAAFRFGHALLMPNFPLINRYGDKTGSIRLSDMFFRPQNMNDQLLDELIRGLAQTLAKKRNGEIIDQVRNLLVTGPENRHILMDLYALNVQRARDHGLEKYNAMRVFYGLPALKSFTELTGDASRAKILEDFYHDVNNVDPWVGILNQKSLPGAIIGELGAEIIGSNFARLRNGDRLWYENQHPASIITEIKTTSFSEIIIRNTGVLEIQEDIFHYHKK